MKEFRRHLTRAVGVWFGFVIGFGVLAIPFTVWAKEIAFVAQEAEDQQAVWLPGEIVIHRSTDFREPLIFRFENPTERTHVFEAPALFESLEEGGVQVTRPVRITIPSKGIEQTVIDRDRMVRDAIATAGEMMTYRFYCPLHRADTDMGGRIVVGQ